MLARLKPAMLLPLAIAALLAAPATASTPEVSGPTQAATGELLFVRLKIEANGKTLEHPGHKMQTGEELVLVLQEGKKKHEAVVYIESTEDGYAVEVTYTAAGNQKLKTTKTGKADEWLTFKSDDGKSKVMVNLRAGGKRKDGIDIGGGNNPLDGLD